MGDKKRICVGLLAHVDAGKTTLSEALLYTAGALRRLGRVDHQDAFLDTDAQERERGITIFSKQAVLPLPEMDVTLLDTPGHVDFSAEMERVLGVLDYAILVISGTDGVQAHTATVWQLLRRYGVPVFLFVNKMDLPNRGRTALLEELQAQLDAGCVAADADGEELAMCDEALLTAYLERGALTQDELADAVARRKLFPVCFGSALTTQGVAEFLEVFQNLTREPPHGAEFGARVFKISRDASGARLTWMKITGGALPVKTVLSGPDWKEKADQIRIYSGDKFTACDCAQAGTVCAVTGLTKTFAGQGLGAEQDAGGPVLVPVLACSVEADSDLAAVYRTLRPLEEEDPQLHLDWNAELGELQLQLMGEVQLEVLRRLIADRFGLRVRFGPGRILYRETIAAPVEGVGHFEPLRHYAEVHLLLEPGERGSGLQFASAVSTDVLALNWQRLVLTHLEEKAHLGVLTGSPITDMKITLVAGRAHLKHTEGGDFRQATYRAVRQGLRQAESVLLEPWYTARVQLPSGAVGRAMADFQRLGGVLELTAQQGDTAILTGRAPVRTLRGYGTELGAYTRGEGRLFLDVEGYFPCTEQDEIVAQIGYDPDRDLANTADSVFCSHGAGTVIPWYQVSAYMHLERTLDEPEPDYIPPQPKLSYAGAAATEDELKAIFERTYGTVKPRVQSDAKPLRRDAFETPKKPHRAAPPPAGPEYLLVDGYNIIFAWQDLHEIARCSLEEAREALIEILQNYRGVRGCELIVVFDAYKVKGGQGSVEKRGRLSVVYTREAETADNYIEKVTAQLGRKHRVRVATSDGLEQVIILGHGSLRLSASQFRDEVDAALAEIGGHVAWKV